MKCFVAMAFQHDDTDRVYGVIREVLAEVDIASVRVDQIEHNDNIDDRMMHELATADLTIADLTYARPSVYYEAGHAERAMPVIYTVRRDHLVNRADDVFGNLRVHFDVVMRNIIDWVDPDDPIFPLRLKSRVEEVTREMRKDIAAERALAAARSAFGRLSVNERKAKTEAWFLETLRRSGYHYEPRLRTTPFFIDHAGFYRFLGGVLHTVDIAYHIDPAEKPKHHDSEDPKKNINVFGSLDRVTTIHEHHLIVMFVGGDFSHLCGALASYDPDDTSRTLTRSRRTKLPLLPAEFNGAVTPYRTFVSTGIPLFGSSGSYHGFLTQKPPPGFQHEKHDDVWRFAYAGFKLREVDRITSVSLLDGISSLEDLEPRLRAVLEPQSEDH